MNEIIENVFLVISIVLLVVVFVVLIYLGWFTEDLTDEEYKLRKRIKIMWEIHDITHGNRTDKIIICRTNKVEDVLVLFEDEDIMTLELLGIEKIEYNVTRKNYKQKIKGFLRA